MKYHALFAVALFLALYGVAQIWIVFSAKDVSFWRLFFAALGLTVSLKIAETLGLVVL